MGRPLGTTELSLDQLDTIREMTTNDSTRRAIAEEVGCGMTTVYNYQK